MDFLFGSQNIDKTTCLIHLANQFIINNNIKKSNGYILLFTPPHSKISDGKGNNQNQKGYNFVQYFTNYSPEYKSNIDLIKCYTLTNFQKSCDLINNFRLISRKNKGLKLILIDDITNIIYPWINTILEERKYKAKPEEKAKLEEKDNVYLLFNQVFQYFLSQISLLQSCYQIQCFITINLDHSERQKYFINSPMIFNSIFPFVRNSFFFQKSEEENQIDFEEVKLFFNMKTNKIELSNFEENEQIMDIKDKFLDEHLGSDYKDKKNEWIKNTIGDFIEKINEYKRKQIEILKKKQEEEDSSLTQVDK